MIDEIQKLIDKHLKWLRDKTTLEKVSDEWVKITSPYLDRHNDYIQIYVKKNNNEYVFSDDAYIINDLINSGCKLDAPKRKDLLNITLAGFGVKLVDDALEVVASKDDFAIKKHNFIQAMLAVNDLFYLAEPVVSGLFFEDVEKWLNLSKIRFTKQIQFTGKSGYAHKFNFVIPKSEKQPERILQAINNPNRGSAESFAFRWLDTKTTRPKDSRAYTVLNDMFKTVPAGVIDALRKYEAIPVLWSEKDSVQNVLSG
jgi:hypothetical protein